MQWRGKDETDFTKGLEFTYDGVNRLKNALKPQTATYTYVDTESGINYDLNGNILALNRAGASVDNLTYSYLGNRLSAINDGSGNNTGVKSGPSSYGYDANGNMLTDGNRNATLTYNYLNLPKTVVASGKTLTYDYDAAGNKHKYVADTLTVKYAGIFEYDANNAVKRVTISAGQVQFSKVLPSPASDTLRFDYTLKDHLGNVRVVFDEKGNILQKSDYYPFGLAISRDGSLPANARNGVNRYLYNEKELQVGTGYLDYGARMYMPELGRWGVSDPLSEISRRFSPYTYGNDNPVLMIDPDGMSSSSYNWTSGNYENGGEITDFSSVKGEYGIGQSSGCPPKCSGNEAKTDATSRAQNSVTPQLADGSVHLSQQEESIVYNADSKYKHGEQFSEYEKAVHTGIDIASIAQIWGIAKNVKTLITTATGSAKLLGQPINQGAKQLEWIMAKHGPDQLAKYADKSQFYISSTEEVKTLIQNSTHMPMIKQAGGNILRTVNAGKPIGLDVRSGKSTSIYSVITNPNGNLITAFPGQP